MKRVLYVYLCLLFFVCLNPIALGGSKKKLVLNMGQQTYRTVNLKRLLRQQYPDIPVRDAYLRGVALSAKSQNNNGSVSLFIGRDMIASDEVNGYPDDYYRGDKRSFSDIKLKNRARASRQGAWRLEFEGPVKVHEIYVFIKVGRGDYESPRPRQNPPRPFPPRRRRSYLSANCSLDIGGNIFRPKTKVICTISGKGAVSYAILVNGQSKWSGQLDPYYSSQTFETRKRKVGGHGATYSIVLYDERGRQLESSIF